MVTATAERVGHIPMARLKGGKRSELDRVVAEQAKLVALRRRITLAELLSEMLRAPIHRAYRQEVMKLTQEGSGE